MRPLAAVALGAVLALGGCLHRALAPADARNDVWAQAREPHTRRVNVYEGLGVSAFASATWENAAVRAARVERVAGWREATAEEVAAMRAREADEEARFEEFTVSFFTPAPADNDLDARTTTWRIALVPGDGAPERLPVEVTALRVDSQLRALYPTIGDFDVPYRIRFAKAGPLAPPFTLRIAGPRGRVDFAFTGQPAPQVR